VLTVTGGRLLTETIRTADYAAFGVEYAPRQWLAILRPFIQEIADRVADTGQLQAAIPIAANAFPNASRFFNLNSAASFALKPEYLFGDWRVTSMFAKAPGIMSRIELDDDIEGLRSLQAILSLGAAGSYNARQIRRLLTDDQYGVFDELLKAGVFVSAPHEPAPFVYAGASGIYRLQHASLLYRTARAGVIVDPHLHSGHSVSTDIGRHDLAGHVDAILISHFHGDHWSLSTLMMFPRDTPIIVPKVPASTIICGHMEQMLRDCGFADVRAVEWYSEPLTFGDIEVHVLPFYGEQPLRYDRPSHHAFQNWGNSYVVRSPDYTSWFLIDSGSDARGTMKEVSHYVRNRFGRVDMVLSNLRRFWVHAALYINGGLNWLTLSPAQIEALTSMTNHMLTLGPPEVAEICSIVDARYYLPYAHWWGRLGESGGGEDAEDPQGEVPLLRELADSIASIQGRTQIVPWGIGDGIVCRGRSFEWVPILKGTGTALG